MINTNFITYKNNNHLLPTFKGQRLFSLNLKRSINNGKNYEFIPAFFTEITTKKDLKKLEKVYHLWEKTAYWKKIISNFEDTLAMQNKKYRDKFFIIECPQLKDINSQLQAICQTFAINLKCNISFLQSASVLKNIEKLNGGGTAILRGLCKIADEKQYDEIGLLSSKNAMGWYDKLGFSKVYGHKLPYYELKKTQFQVFLDKTTKEYGEIISLK